MPYTDQHLFVGVLNDGRTICSEGRVLPNIWSKLLVMVLLQGEQHFSIDGQEFHLQAGSGDEKTPVLLMLNIAEQGEVKFFGQSDVSLRKVLISAPTVWLEQQILQKDSGQETLFRKFLSTHLAHFSFEPGEHLQQLAEKIIHPPMTLDGELKAMYLNAQALEIMWQSILALSMHQCDDQVAPRLEQIKNCEKIRDYILHHLSEDLTIEAIACNSGMSVSSVQRHFKDHYQVTIFEFIRGKRLELAKAALEQEGIAISYAAHMAHYSSVSSFTTAFKKAFGMTPKSVQH